VDVILAETLPRLPDTTGPLLRAARWALSLVPGLAADWVQPPPPDATMAYVGSIDAFARRLPLRAAAMLLRVLEEAEDQAAPRLDALVTRWCEVYGDRFGARWVPVAHQIEHQARTTLAAVRHAQG
jgi:hypothetical protein